MMRLTITTYNVLEMLGEWDIARPYNAAVCTTDVGGAWRVPPLCGSMKPNGEIVAVGAYDGDEQPPSQALIDLMAQIFRREAGTGRIRAAGICYDVRTIPPGQTAKCDAVCVSLEHQSGEAADVFLPYRKTSQREVQYSEMFATSRIPEFFVPKSGIGTVNGRSTVEYEGTNLRGEVGRFWLDRALRFPVKWQSEVSSGELRNIQEGVQPPSLFDVPPGFRRTDLSH